MQDLFQKSDQKLHVYDFSNVFPELFSLFGTAVNVSFEQRCRIQFLNFISQEERNIKHFQFWTVEIVHCHIDGSAAQWHGPWTQHVNRSSHARIFLNERTKPCYCKVESKVHSWNQNMQFLLVIKWNDCSAVIFCCSVKRVWTLGTCGKSWNGIFPPERWKTNLRKIYNGMIC